MNSRCIASSLRHTTVSINTFYDDIIRSSGLTGSQYALLRAANKHPSASMNKLSEYVHVDKSTLCRTANSLQEKGFINILPGANKKTKNITLTPSGKTCLSYADVLWLSAQKKITQIIGGDENVASFLNILDKINEMCKKGSK